MTEPTLSTVSWWHLCHNAANCLAYFFLASLYDGPAHVLCLVVAVFSVLVCLLGLLLKLLGL